MDLVSVDDDDIRMLREFEAQGIEVEFRMLPREKRRTLDALL